MYPSLNAIRGSHTYYQTRRVDARAVLTGRACYQMPISYMSKVPAQYAGDVTTAGTCADQRRYGSKSLFSDRYLGVWLETIRVGKFAGLESVANRMRKQLRLPTMHSASPFSITAPDAL